MSNLTECNNCQIENCSYIQCGKEITNKKTYLDSFKKKNEFCIPRNLSYKLKKNFCNNFDNVNTYREINECEYDFKYEYHSMNDIILFSIIIIILSLTFTIIYYNNYVIKNKSPPFQPPSLFPRFLLLNSGEDSQISIKKSTDEITKLGTFYRNI